jgi:hypothetical protein
MGSFRNRAQGHLRDVASSIFVTGRPVRSRERDEQRLDLRMAMSPERFGSGSAWIGNACCLVIAGIFQIRIDNGPPRCSYFNPIRMRLKTDCKDSYRGISSPSDFTNASKSASPKSLRSRRRSVFDSIRRFTLSLSPNNQANPTARFARSPAMGE